MRNSLILILIDKVLCTYRSCVLYNINDKITYFAANKAVLRNIIPEEDAPYTDFRPDEPVDAFVSEVSIDHRMVTSILKYGSAQKLMIELDRSIKDILGIPYDVKNI